MWWLLVVAAFATPPSSVLTGENGTLSWEVREEGGKVYIHGTSPKWDVLHVARADLTPERTVHTHPDGFEATIEYGPAVTVVHLPDEEVRREQAGLWDGDTVEIRLGALTAAGHPDNVFSIVDPTSGKIYKMDSAKVGDETCGATACTHVRVQLTGMLRWVGPTWEYWYGPDGRLLRFSGPIGEFSTSGPR